MRASLRDVPPVLRERVGPLEKSLQLTLTFDESGLFASRDSFVKRILPEDIAGLSGIASAVKSAQNGRKPQKLNAHRREFNCNHEPLERAN